MTCILRHFGRNCGYARLMYISEPLYLIAHYPSKLFSEVDAFWAYPDMPHVRIKFISVESVHFTTHVKRYYLPILRAFNIIRKEPPDIEEGVFLQMSVKSINASAGLEELVPTLLLFGALVQFTLSWIARCLHHFSMPPFFAYQPYQCQTLSRQGNFRVPLKQEASLMSPRSLRHPLLK